MQTGRSTEHGYTFIGLLIVIMVIGFSLAEAGNIWSQQRQRDREQELLKIGDKFRLAIRDYYNATPGPIKQYPKNLQALLRDDRFPIPKRYIRKIYEDPMTQSQVWGRYEAPGGGIMGVFSTSIATPFKTRNFPPIYSTFENKTNYGEWVFGHVPELAAIDKSSTTNQ
ncbi:secretion system X pseudopilin PulG-like protein [Methylovorus sp. MM2]|uniref:type II secretion system protein n=1 Tax=Methylovorus sp. MM2 TaxID=1848038 RepID=UPI0007DFF9A6|nr:type II secretion system protein [Methylovorus sp. MM2]OAM51332.1 secretion system X pseudopilin PulG-like protein [Methylovorus sp. MM2]